MSVQMQPVYEKLSAVKAELAESELATWRAFLAAHALMIRAIERELAREQLPPLGWYDVLFALYEAPDRRLRIHELADAVVLSRSGLSRLVDRLEAAGLLRRAAVAGDRRGAYAEITRDGIRMLRRMWPVYAQCIAEHFVPQLGPNGPALRRALEGIPASVRERESDAG
jgi:DNA-binding MarR family transcriptional regulator